MAITMADRITGCILGGAIGDALGAPIEFASTEQINRQHPGPMTTYLSTNYPPTTYPPLFGSTTGLVTDDTQMTLFTIEGIIRADIRFTLRGICHQPAVMLNAYLRWLNTQEDIPNSDGWLSTHTWLYAQRAPGITVMNALNQAKETNQLEASNDSKGCGTVMRSAPFGLLNDSDPTYAMHCAALTHGHPTAHVASGAFMLLIDAITQGADLNSALENTIDWLTRTPHSQETLQALTNIKRATSIEELGEGWIAEEALAMGIYAALKHPRPEHFAEALSLSVKHGGDSDSTGSITGNILGALHGTEALPANLLNALEGKDTITTIAQDLATLIMAPQEVFNYENIQPNQIPVPDIKSEWWERYPGS